MNIMIVPCVLVYHLNEERILYCDLNIICPNDTAFYYQGIGDIFILKQKRLTDNNLHSPQNADYINGSASIILSIHVSTG